MLHRNAPQLIVSPEVNVSTKLLCGNWAHFAAGTTQPAACWGRPSLPRQVCWGVGCVCMGGGMPAFAGQLTRQLWRTAQAGPGGSRKGAGFHSSSNPRIASLRPLSSPPLHAAVVGVIFIFKFALVAAVMMWVLWSLKQLPYHTHRMKNVAVRLQVGAGMGTQGCTALPCGRVHAPAPVSAACLGGGVSV